MSAAAVAGGLEQLVSQLLGELAIVESLRIAIVSTATGKVSSLRTSTLSTLKSATMKRVAVDRTWNRVQGQILRVQTETRHRTALQIIAAVPRVSGENLKSKVELSCT